MRRPRPNVQVPYKRPDGSTGWKWVTRNVTQSVDGRYWIRFRKARRRVMPRDIVDGVYRWKMM